MPKPKNLVKNFAAGSVVVIVFNLGDDCDRIREEDFSLIPLLIQKTASGTLCRQNFAYCDICDLYNCLREAGNWILAEIR